MADEAEEAGGGDGGEDGGSPLKKYGPLAAIVLVAQAVLAWILIQFILNGSVPEEEQEQLVPEQSVEVHSESRVERVSLPYYYSSPNLTNVTANPAGTNSERFVVVSLQLGLVGYNRDENPPDDITDQMILDDKKHAEVMKIKTVEQRIVSVVTKTLRLKTIDELEGEFIDDVEKDILDKLNKEIFSRMFAIDENNSIEIIVTEVDISSIIIQ